MILYKRRAFKNNILERIEVLGETIPLSRFALGGLEHIILVRLGRHWDTVSCNAVGAFGTRYPVMLWALWDTISCNALCIFGTQYPVPLWALGIMSYNALGVWGISDM